MRIVNWLLLPLACTLLTAEAFIPDYKIEFSVETFLMPEKCPDQILLGDRVCNSSTQSIRKAQPMPWWLHENMS